MRLFFAMAVTGVVVYGAASADNENDIEAYGSAERAYLNGDFAAALQEFRHLAEDDSDIAQIMLGEMYERGEGVEQDLVQAYFWYHLVAEEPFEQAHEGLSAEDKSAEVFVIDHDIVIEQAWYAREALAGKMTPSQIAEAQKSAREWEEIRPHQTVAGTGSQ